MAFSYGLSDDASVSTDEQKAKALEAQASDLEKVATTLEATQPAAALSLKTQVMNMRQQAETFRKVSGLPPASSWLSHQKAGVALGVLALVAGGYWLGSHRK